MKTTLIALLLSLTWSTAGDDLAKLKIIRRDMIAKAMQPINDSFKREVQRLLDEAIRLKKLDDAVKLRDELTQLSIMGSYHPKGIEGFHFTFGEDGVCWQTANGNQVGVWKVENGRLKFNQSHKSQFDVDVETLEGTLIYEGKPQKVKLVRDA